MNKEEVKEIVKKMILNGEVFIDTKEEVIETNDYGHLIRTRLLLSVKKSTDFGHFSASDYVRQSDENIPKIVLKIDYNE